MKKKSAGNQDDSMDRANLTHAVNTLGAASRSLATLPEYQAIAEEVEQTLEFLTKELKAIRERERGRETK